MRNSSLTLILASGLILTTACDSGSSSSSGGADGTANSCPAYVAPHAIDQPGPKLTSADNGSGPLQTLKSHRPRSLTKLTDKGALADAAPLDVTVALPLNNETELDQRLAQIATPGNPNFRHYMSAQDFMDRYAPTPAQVATVQSYLKSQGIDPGEVSENRMLVHASGTPKALGAAFHTELHQFVDSQGTAYRAPAYELQIPEGLPIQGVHGLQNVSRFRAHAVTGAANAPGSGPDGGYAPADFRKAYHIPSGVTGAGQVIALFELDGYAASDIAAYESQFGLPNVTLTNVLVDGATGAAGSNQSEVDLDIELASAVAPGASIMVYEGSTGESGRARHVHAHRDRQSRQGSQHVLGRGGR